MAKFTAKRLMEVCESQNGTVGGNKYADYFNRPDLRGQDWCCTSGCYCLAESGRNIGCWPNCGRVEAEGGIQAGMLKAGFKKCASIDKASTGACIIINHHNDTYLIFDHFVIWMGTFSYQNGVKGIDVWNGNASNTFKKSWYPLSHIEAIYMPNFDNETGKNGWVKENGTWYHYTNGQLDRNGWFKGNDGKYYYVGSDGSPVKNEWHQGTSGSYKGKWYYCGDEGYPVTNKWVCYKEQYYYCGSDGTPVKGWKQIGGTWYHFDDDCVAEHDTLAEHNGAWYWLGEDGTIVVDQDVTLVFHAGFDGKLSIS